MKTSSRIVAAAVCVIAASGGCRPKAESDRIPKDVSVTAVALRKVFDGNWNVRINIGNQSTGEFVLEQLADGDIYVQNERGQRVFGHPLSVGRAKKLSVNPMSSKSADLLFGPSGEVPRELHLLGRNVGLPSAAISATAR